MKVSLFAEPLETDMNSGFIGATIDNVVFTNNPLIIVARQSQVERVSNLILGGNVIGWWELGSAGYLDRQGKIKSAAFKKHDAVFYTDPSRVFSAVRDTYIKLITALESV